MNRACAVEIIGNKQTRCETLAFIYVYKFFFPPIH